MKFRIVLCIIFSLMSFSTVTVAKENMKNDAADGFSGRIEMGILGISTDTKVTGIDSRGFLGLNPDFSTINDLGNSRTMDSFGTLFFLFDLNYALNEDTSFYVGTPFFDDDREGLTFGFERLFQDNSSLNASFFLGATTCWKDPYLVGVMRDITYSDFHGITLNYSGILGSDLTLSYTIRKDKVSEDVSGNTYPELRRSGTTHSFKGGYNFYLSEGLDTTFTPSIKYINNRSDGDANSYRGFGAEFNVTVNKEKNALSMSTIVETMGYVGVHPLFGKKRSDMVYTAECFYTRKNLWGKNWYTRMGAAYNRTDSNIPFFNENNILYGVSLGYTFN